MSEHNIRFQFGAQKCGSVASHPDTALFFFVNECRIYVDFDINKYGPTCLMAPG